MSIWRMAGLNYVDYSNIAAKTLRHSLKAEFKAEAIKRDETVIQFIFWDGGSPLPAGQKPTAANKSEMSAKEAGKI